MDIAKKNLAITLNRLNLVGSSGVLKSTSDLLDFLNEHKDKDYDTLRLHNILNTLVIEARRDLNPNTCTPRGGSTRAVPLLCATKNKMIFCFFSGFRHKLFLS